MFTAEIMVAMLVLMAMVTNSNVASGVLCMNNIEERNYAHSAQLKASCPFYPLRYPFSSRRRRPFLLGSATFRGVIANSVWGQYFIVYGSMSLERDTLSDLHTFLYSKTAE